MNKLLILEDDPTLSLTMLDLLRLEGFEVDLAVRGQEALDLSYANAYDLYLLDVNVNDINGFELLKMLRESGDDTPAIFITALRDINSLAKGFEVGADDYIKKPFDVDELIIRIHSKLKPHAKEIHCADVCFSVGDKMVRKAGKIIDLGEVLLEVFVLLIMHRDQTVDKVQFYEVMENPSDQALRVHINKLKKILGIDIVNVRGIGYRLEKS